MVFTRTANEGEGARLQARFCEKVEYKNHLYIFYTFEIQNQSLQPSFKKLFEWWSRKYFQRATRLHRERTCGCPSPKLKACWYKGRLLNKPRRKLGYAAIHSLARLIILYIVEKEFHSALCLVSNLIFLSKHKLLF